MGMDYKKMIKNSRLEAGKLMTEEQIAACNVAIHTAAVASGGAGFIPIPVADAVPISVAQIAMVIALGKIFDQEYPKAQQRGLLVQQRQRSLVETWSNSFRLLDGLFPQE